MSSKFYITTSIPYANAAPHVGHILDPLIADVLARYHRIKGKEVRFLVGTDEHGAKIVRKAEEEDKTPKELVDENSAKFREMQNTLNISYDDFIRTSDQKRHWPGAEKMWREMVASGDIYKKEYHGLYCVGHEAFVTEKDLVNGKCQDHQKEPEAVEEENWFFRLSKYAQEIASRIKNDELQTIPESRKNEILSFIESGLEDVSFSRPAKDLSWGVPVPDDPTQTMYVWSDALVNYISAIGYGHDDPESQLSLKKWWPADVQVIGKDNLRFHAAIWPGMLLSAGLELPKAIFVHGFVNVEGQKISKTVGNVIPPETVVQKYGVDPVRYYFLREFPSYEDGDFSYKKFEDRYNGDLANGLGNLVARVSTLGESISPIHFDFQKDIITEAKKETARVFAEYEKHVTEVRLNEALAIVWALVSFTDKYINDEKPWEKSGDDFKGVIINAAYVIGVISNLLQPFLPQTAEKISTQISFEDSVVRVKKGVSLFPRLK
ncbi:MAG: methionine--tRNA ligase [Candidatus Sungiibacteriota bacterium]|uniref:Methionine--tRNA ligase n=1 Tax=Candidatus Sungiibacteriota bacterium TaxID=2750080 RepID=A0A7T5RIX8_9BACT|nr:MAG: methionine--tRNA ligase [Candidatus Sungbacteria bacterium]